MRKIKCKNCGKFVLFDTTISDDIYDEILYYTKLANNDKKNRNVYLSIISSLRKMVNQINHRHTQIFERQKSESNLNGILVKYIRENNLLTDEQIQEMRDIARENAKKQDKIDSEIIQKISEDYEIFKYTSTRHGDSTANKAIKNIDVINKNAFIEDNIRSEDRRLRRLKN